jgi:hypothetical protein
MKSGTLGGAAVAAVALALAGTAPAAAKGKAHHATKPAAEKHKCGGKNGCPAAGEGGAKSEAGPTTSEKPAEAK